MRRILIPAASLIAALLLAACTVGPPVKSLSVADGAVVIAAPTGHCIDPGSRRMRSGGTFLVLGSCAAMSGQASPPVSPVLLTALVSAPLAAGVSPGPAELRGYFSSSLGRATLAADGQAASVRILGTRQRGDVLYLQMRDSSVAKDALSGDIWRAAFRVSSHVVVLSAQGLAAQPVSTDAALNALTRFVAATDAANRVARN